MPILLDPVTQMSGFTTELTTWEQVKAIADFTWPLSYPTSRLITCTKVDLNGSFFVTPVSVSSSDILIYGAAIKDNQVYVTGESDVDTTVPDNGTGVLAKEISSLRGDAERKALRFVTSISGRVKLECPQVEAQASDAGEVEADA